MRRYIRSLLIIVVLVAVAATVLLNKTITIRDFTIGSESILGLNLGLDLQGGSDLRFQAVDPQTGEPFTPTKDEMNALIRSIEERINRSGLGRPAIQQLGENRLLVQLPGVEDLDRAKSLIGETAQLEYKKRTLNVPADLTISDEVLAIEVKTIGGATTTQDTVEENQTDSTDEADENSTSTEAQISENIDDSQAIPALVIEFTDSGATQFDEMIDRMRISLAPVIGTERENEEGELIPGSGDIYPNYIEVTVLNPDSQTTSTPVTLSYSPVAILPNGGKLSMGGEPYVKRIGSTNRFALNLNGAGIDVELASSLFSEDKYDSLNFVEIKGKVDDPVGLTGKDMSRAYPSTHQTTGLPIVNIEFNSDGAKTFGEVTTEMYSTGDLLVIELDDKELISSRVQSPITAGVGFIEGPDFTMGRVRDLSLLIESGRLPFPIELIQERDVDAILGADSLAKSLIAGLIGLALVLLFMLLYYRLPGLIANLALLIYATLLLSLFKLIGVTLELSGLAATILSIGMAVDANILIFERMKEELNSGRTLLSSINIGFSRAWPAIRDGNVSTLITCGILFWFADTLGATMVQSFSATLALGVIVSLFTAITVSRTLLRIIAVSSVSKYSFLFLPTGKPSR